MRRSLFVIMLAIGVAAAAPAPASAAPRRFTIVGHGFGHGIGMGQWGARGMAAHGSSWLTIVHHYYTGVRVARIAPGDIDVLIERAAFALTGGSRSSAWIGRRRVASTTHGVRAFRIVPRGSGLQLDVLKRRWRAVRTTSGAIVVTRRGTVKLLSRNGDRAFHGSFVFRRAGGSVQVVNRLPLDAYLAGVVPREMPASWPSQALRAQAVAARTYAVRVRALARARRASYDICSTTACQVYGGVARRTRGGSWIALEDRRSNAAISATHGVILTYRGAAILAQYSSSTGGYTAPGGQPYLRPVRDPYDRVSPYHSWRVTVASSSIARLAPRVGTVLSVRVARRVDRRVRSVAITGTRGTARISGARFAGDLGLRSSWFGVVRPHVTWRTAVRAVRTEHAVHSHNVRFTFDLYYGMRSSVVRALQARLKAAGYFPRSVPDTGFYGPITYASVMRYQRAHGIRQTGYVGPLTRATLNSWA